MTNDAKLGLLAGVAAVVLVAVVYFPKPAAGSANERTEAAIPKEKSATAAGGKPSKPVQVSLTSRSVAQAD